MVRLQLLFDGRQKTPFRQKKTRECGQVFLTATLPEDFIYKNQ